MALLWNATTNTRNKPANAAAFTALAMYATTGVGEPWYTSGAHAWNGTAAILKPNPTNNNAKPASNSAGGLLDNSEGSTEPGTLPIGVVNAAMWPRFVDP